MIPPTVIKTSIKALSYRSRQRFDTSFDNIIGTKNNSIKSKNNSFVPNRYLKVRTSPKCFCRLIASYKKRKPMFKRTRLSLLNCCQLTVNFYYSIILATAPAPTVLPPSRIAKRRPSSIAIGVISLTSISTLSPGITISTPSGSVITPVTSVVLK